MRELVYYVAVSIDGYIALPDGSYEAFPLEGDHMAAYVSEFADALPSHVLSALGKRAPGNLFDTVIQGRRSASDGICRIAVGNQIARRGDVHGRRTRDGARVEATIRPRDLSLRRRKSRGAPSDRDRSPHPQAQSRRPGRRHPALRRRQARSTRLPPGSLPHVQVRRGDRRVLSFGPAPLASPSMRSCDG